MEKDAGAAAQQAMELFTTYAFDVIGALVILIVGWIIAGWAGRTTRGRLDKSAKIDDTLAPFMGNIVRYVILAVVLVAVLGKFGIETASIIAVLGTVGLAVGLALQGTLSHFAAGVVLLILRPFRVEEFIDTGGLSGTVKEIGLFATVLNTVDGVVVYIPNGQLLNSSLKNFSRATIRRIDVTVGIAYEDDVEKALAAAKSFLESDSRILKDPAPETMVVALADSSVNINLRCWVNPADYWAVLFDNNKGIKLKLDAEGITIPFPQQDVHIQDRTAA